MISVCFQGKPFNITVIQVYAPTSIAQQAEVGRFYKDLQDLWELTPPKNVLFIRGLECKSRKSRNTWSNRQIWPWNTEWSRAKTNSVLPRKCTGHNKHPLPTTQEKILHMDITKWSTTEIRLIIFFAAKDGEALYSQQKQDQELTVAQTMNSFIAKFRLKLKKVGKTTRPIRYNLNQIP